MTPVSPPARSAQRSDVIGFTRIFVLFCALVLLPSLLMSSFGVIAIMNERAADKQRRRDAASLVLQRAEEDFGRILENTDRDFVAALTRKGASAPDIAVLALRQQGLPLGPWLIVNDSTVLAGAAPFHRQDDESSLALTSDPLGARLSQLLHDVVPGRPAHALVEEQRFFGVVSVQRLTDGRGLVYALDEVRLDAAIFEQAARLGANKGDMHPTLRMAKGTDAAVENAVDRLLKEVERARAVSVDETDEELASRRLESPFDCFTLTVHALPSGASTKTIAAYIALMVVFLSTLITGVVITARLIWQETRLSRLKTDFVSHMSHELRTPLTSIRMFIETLRLGRARSDDEKQQCLDLLSKETERLSEMIERVLGYARLRAGRRVFSPRAVHPQLVVDEALEAFRAHNLDLRDLTLTTHVQAGVPAVRADPEALVEALVNLVGNAYKYSGAHKEIDVFARRSRPGRVVFGVKDNGPGLPKAEHHRVFERFYQAGGLLSSKKPGSGLGLAITKAIVEGQGGRITVDSEVGKGATFAIELRVDKAK